MLALLFAGLLAAGGLGGVPSNPFHATHAALAAPAAKLLMHLNSARYAAHRATLLVDPVLNELAQADAKDMARRQYFSHYSPDGRSLTDRILAAHYSCEYAGENIAMAGTESEAYQALLKSPGHRENMLSAHYTKVGIGVAVASDGVLLFVEEFSD